MFEVGFSPDVVDAMPLARVAFWHKRAAAYFKRRNEADRANSRNRE